MEFYGKDSFVHFFEMTTSLCEKGAKGEAQPIDVVQLGFNLRPVVDMRALDVATKGLGRPALLTDQETIAEIIRIWHEEVKDRLAPADTPGVPDWSGLLKLMQLWQTEAGM